MAARLYFGRIGAACAGAKSHSGSGTDGRDDRDIAYGGNEEFKVKAGALSIDKEEMGKEKGLNDDNDDHDDVEREFHIREIEAILNVFSDSYMNKHLIFGIVETLLDALVPEMRERGSGELLGDRLG